MLGDIRWSTVYPEIAAGIKLNFRDRVYTCGSCFAIELSNNMVQLYMPVFNHPFGIVFNPLSIALQIKRIADQQKYTIEDLWKHNGLFHSPDHHGKYSKSQAGLVLDEINPGLETAHAQLRASQVILITLGSAHYYRHKATAKVVANCHKIPQNEFEKSCATIAEIVNSMQDCIDQIKKLNQDIHFIFSVSPVRYLKDGFHENALSKSKLLIAVDELCKSNRNAEYFPAFELFMDELREYRFTKADLVHPNQIAIDYIFSRFSTAYYDEESQEFISRMSKYNAMKNHKILHEDSEQYFTFQQQLLEETKKLKSSYPELLKDL